MDEDILDGREPVDGRLETLRKRGQEMEERIAVLAYERLKTAREIARSVLTNPPSDADVVAIFGAMCRIAQEHDAAELKSWRPAA
jgi:hypothetical protein